MATKTTVELRPGDRVLLAGRHVRTVERVADSGDVNYRNEPILGVFYAEGRTSTWSEGNSGAPGSSWELYEARVGEPCPCCEGQLDACAVCQATGLLLAS